MGGRKEEKKDKLENALKKASELKEEDYTADAWAVFQNALPAFQAVFDDPNATQEQVDEAVRAVNAAIAELKRHPASGEEPKAVDKTALKAALDAADALNPSDYTADGWEVFQKAIEAARAVYADENATQEQVDEAVSAVNAAVAELKKHPVSGGNQKPGEDQKPGDAQKPGR